MKHLSFVIFTICTLASAQLGTDAPWMATLNKKSIAPTYEEIKQAGERWFETHDKNQKGSGYKPFMRWVSQAEAYVKVDGTLQTPEEIDAILAKRALRFKNTTTDNSNWMPIGPFQVAGTGSWSTGTGRVNTTTVDPNNSSTYYIGTPSGGIWKSTDAGVNWAPISDFLSEIGVSAIAIDPNDSNIIYIGTGDDDANDTNGFGLLKSTDGGVTWNATGLSFGGNGDSINEVYLDPTNSNTLFVSSERGFYKSVDAGATFTRTFPGLVDDIKLKPGDPNVIYLATNNAFFKSTNKGDSFLPVAGLPTGVSRMVIGVTPANANYVYLLIVDNNQALIGLYRSTDSGNSFIKRDNGTDILESPQAWFDLAMAVSPTNAEIVFTGCLNVWRSTNGGAAFTKINSWSNPSGASYTHADIHQLRFFDNELFASTDGGVYRSTNLGTNFTDLTETAQIGQFYRIAVSKQSSADVIGGLQDNGGQTRSNDQWKNFYGADGMDGGIDPNNSNVRFGFVQNGGALYFTTNSGNNLLGSINRPAGENGNWITPLKVDNAGTIYAGYSRLYKVQNNNFVAVSQPFPGNIEHLEIAPGDDNLIYVAVDSRIYRSTDAGASFTPLASFPRNITSIEAHHDNTNIVYVSTSGSIGKVYKSTDQAGSFTDITSNLPNLGKNTLAHQPLSPNNELYVGTTRGVYKYSEVDAQWNLFSNNLPNVIVRDLEINGTDNILTAGTYGRGIWQTAITTSSPNDDIGLSNITTGANSNSCSTDSIEVTVVNNGTNTINSYDVSYSVNGGAIATNTYNTTIAPQGQDTVTISNLTLLTGANTIDVSVITANDTFATNNDQSFTINNNFDGGINDIHGFENRDFITESNSSPSSVWQRGVPTGAVLNQAVGGSQVYATNLSGNYGDESIDYLYTGCYDLVGITNPTLEFDMAFIIENNWDLLYMEYSTDGGNSWTVLGSSSDPNWYNSNRTPNGTDCFNCIGAQWTGTASTFYNYSYDLTAFNNEPNISFRFVFHTDQSVNEEGVVIDNFVVTGTLSNNDVPSLENTLQVYPNPSDGRFNLQWDNAPSYNYQIYDVSGKLLQQKRDITTRQHALDLEGVAQGVYFLHIQSEGSTITKKLIVQ